MRIEKDNAGRKTAYIRINERQTLRAAFDYMRRVLDSGCGKRLSKKDFLGVMEDCILGDATCPDAGMVWYSDPMSLEEYRIRKAVNGEDADYDSEEQFKDVAYRELERLVEELESSGRPDFMI